MVILPPNKPFLSPDKVRSSCRRTGGMCVMKGRAMSRPMPLMRPFDWKNGVRRSVTRA